MTEQDRPLELQPEPADGEPAPGAERAPDEADADGEPAHRSSSVAPAARGCEDGPTPAGVTTTDGEEPRLLRRAVAGEDEAGRRTPTPMPPLRQARRSGASGGRRRPPGPLPVARGGGERSRRARRPTPRSCPTCRRGTRRIRRPPSGCSCASLRSATPGRPRHPHRGYSPLRAGRRAADATSGTAGARTKRRRKTSRAGGAQAKGHRPGRWPDAIARAPPGPSATAARSVATSCACTSDRTSSRSPCSRAQPDRALRQPAIG